MSDIKTILKEKPFPITVVNNPVFEQYKEIKKIFPEIGLPNSEKEVEVDNTTEARKAGNNLVSEISNLISDRLRTITKYSKNKNILGKIRKSKLENNIKFLVDFKKQLTKKCLLSNNGRFTLNLVADILDNEGKVVFKAGEGVFRVFNKLNDILREGKFLAMDKFENTYSFKEFSSKNVPNLKFKIRFSSDGSEGLWDIATMSMRGISSCQSWSSSNSSHIVGSLVDPFTAIIYLTSGGKINDYGSKMIRRCVVRYALNKNKNQSFIAIEKMYPSMERDTLNKFISFIKEKTDNKFNVVYLPSCAKISMFVPLSKIVNYLSPHEQPYVDSGMPYLRSKSDKDLDYDFDRLYDNIASKIVGAASSTKLTSIDIGSRAFFKSMRNDSYCFYMVLFQDIKAFFEKNAKFTSKESVINSIDLFIKDSIEARIIRAVKSFNLQERTMMNDSVLANFASVTSEKIKKFLNTELKKLTAIKASKTIEDSTYLKFLKW